MNKLLKYGIWGALTLCYYLLYTDTLSYVIAYHEQHHLFLFSEAYFEQTFHSEGIWRYLTDFIIQFFHHSAWGSFLLALLLSTIYLLCQGIIRKLFGKDDLLQLSVIPSLALFFYTIDVSHQLTPITTTVVCLCLANVVLWLFRRYLPLVPLFKKVHVRNPKIRYGLTAVSIFAYGYFGYQQFLKCYNPDEALIQKTEMYAKAKDWNNVLSLSRQYLNGQKTTQQIAYFYHLALFHTGELPYRLFDYPPLLGTGSLHYPWSNYSSETEYGHYLYEDLGHLNEAHRWEFEAMVAWGETAPHLLNLAKYNIVIGRPKVAQRFINKLKQSLFYKDDALQLEKVKESGQVKGLRNALANVPDSIAQYSNPVNLTPDLEFICDYDPTNRMAFEYLMCNLLLGNRVVRFVENLHRIKHFNYSTLPPAFEEAIFLYKKKVGEEAFAQTGLTVNPEMETRYARFLQLMRHKKMWELQQEFGKSYWFYLTYISPYRNNK